MRLKDISILDPAPLRNAPMGEVSFIPMESLYDGYIKDPGLISFQDGKNGYTYFASGDLLIAKVTPCFENGNIAIAEGLANNIGFGSSEIFVLRMGKKAINTYIFYLAQTSHFRTEACRRMCGAAGLKRVPSTFMRTYELELPDLPTQRRIVAFLDDQTAEIDRKIAILQKQLDAYARLKTSIIHHAVTRGLDPNVRLKDSGVDWIGQIPEHWKCFSIKNLCVSVTGGAWGEEPIDEDGAEVCLRVADFDFAAGRFKNISRDNITLRSYNDQQKCNLLLKEGDLVVEKSGGGDKTPVGRAVIFDKKIRALFSNFMARIKLDSKLVIPFFMEYWWIFLYHIGVEKKYIKQNTGIQNLSLMRMLREIEIILPDIKEQGRIVSSLRNSCERIDFLIEKTSQEINLLKRLKRALINETVTGRRAV